MKRKKIILLSVLIVFIACIGIAVILAIESEKNKCPEYIDFMPSGDAKKYEENKAISIRCPSSKILN